MKLSINLSATAGYLHVWRNVIRRIVIAADHRPNVHIVYVGDDTKECREAFDLLYREVPKAWEKEFRPLKLENIGKPYKVEQQKLIARMHGEAFAASRAVRADQCWTVEGDILVPPDALRMMEWALQMPQEDGSPYYDVAICTYPNRLFIGGRGDPLHPIAQDFSPEERKLTTELQERYKKHMEEERAFLDTKRVPSKEWQDKAQQLAEEIAKCEPTGNVWELNAKNGWRPRGWIDLAYPAIGRGSIVPVDWVGEGCNLLSRRALSLASFEGYEGNGTQDLFLCWRKYNPAGIRMACITHTVCDHVKKVDGKLIHYKALHEQIGESKGHLRVVEAPWVEM